MLRTLIFQNPLSPKGERVRVRGLLAIISSIFLSLSFSTFNLSFLAWVGLVPFFFAIENQSPKRAFCVSYLCGFLFFLLSMYWLIYVTSAGWVALSLYQALYFGLFGFFCRCLFTAPYSPSALLYRLRVPLAEGSRLSRTNVREAKRGRGGSYDNIRPGGGPYLQLSSYLAIPSAWCMLEYLRSHIGGGIGWNLMGYSQYQNTPLIQIADITGVYGVSFLIVLINFTVFIGIKMAIKCQRTHRCLFVKSTIAFKEEIKISPLLQTLTVFFIVVVVLAYGYKRTAALNRLTASVSKKLRISVVQGNIPQLHKWDSSYKDHIMEKYEEISLEAAEDRPQLIIWPETSVPGYINEDKTLLEYIQGLTERIRSFLLVGVPVVAKKGPGGTADYNSAILFSKRGRLLQQYNKLHLVIFGEYIPFEKYLPYLRKFLPLTGEFISGHEYTLFQLQAANYKLQIKFGVLICFEDIFPDMVRRFIKGGADFMVNITNDAWFGRSAAAYQHAANSVFRAVENRRPFTRSANTGLSCFIDRVGVIYSRVSSGGADLFIDGFKTDIVKILPDEPFTFYTRFGDIFVLFCSSITGLFIIDYLHRQRYNKNLR